MLTMLHQIDTSVLSMRKLGVIVFGCWTLLRFKECMVKTLMDESIQVAEPYLRLCTYDSNDLRYSRVQHPALCCVLQCSLLTEYCMFAHCYRRRLKAYTPIITCPTLVFCSTL